MTQMTPDLTLVETMNPDKALIAAGQRLEQAQHDWCESFLRYRMSVKDRTDTQAKAMADIDTNLMGARVAYDYALLRYRLHILRGEADAGEPTSPTH